MIPLSLVNPIKLSGIIEDRTLESGRANISDHLKKWSREKYNLYKIFGEKLQIRRPLEVSKSLVSVDLAVNEFVEMHCSSNINYSLVTLFLLHSSILTMCIRNNSLTHGVYFLSHKFAAGMKISKCIGKLCKNNADADYIQEKFSVLLESFKTNGTVVLSIDPMDYLTMSESASGWRSCQSLDGEYRTATLAYMMDSCTAVAYLESESFIKEPSYGVLSKMWRQLVYISTDGTFAVQSKQYPKVDDTAQSTVSALLCEVLNLAKQEQVGVSDVRRSEIIEDNNSDQSVSLWYNDINRDAFVNCVVISNEGFDSINRFDSTALVGVISVNCACGCGRALTDGGSLFYESIEENEAEQEGDDYWS
jgi:hypothetical protein